MSSEQTEHDEHGGHGHPGVAEYVEVGVILAVVTAAEVSLFYANVARQITIPLLLFLTVIKFALVAYWFMHLRFDARLYRRLFFVGLVLAALVFGVMFVIIAFASPMG